MAQCSDCHSSWNIFSQKLRRSLCQDTALQQLWASRELNIICWAPEWLSQCLIDGRSTAVWSSVLFTSCDNQEQLLKKQLVTYTDQILQLISDHCGWTFDIWRFVDIYRFRNNTVTLSLNILTLMRTQSKVVKKPKWEFRALFQREVRIVLKAGGWWEWSDWKDGQRS